ncbi:hypothetical protein [Frankia sp. Cj3]|uniref:hypothetical protein n=1 Tax=Frankia sp. Cj3 TaxID=2880976 RepID=UPI001EF6797A|nr:hypothetical protein [Frankia sp. Cj3]
MSVHRAPRADPSPAVYVGSSVAGVICIVLSLTLMVSCGTPAAPAPTVTPTTTLEACHA